MNQLKPKEANKDLIIEGLNVEISNLAYTKAQYYATIQELLEENQAKDAKIQELNNRIAKLNKAK